MRAMRIRRAWRAAVGLTLFTLIFYVWCGIGEADLRVPLTYAGDAVDVYALQGSGAARLDAQTRLMAPLGPSDISWRTALTTHLFQINANLIALAAALVGGEIVLGLNLYFLLTFVLAFATASYAARRIGLRNPLAFLVGTAYALMPFHFQRGVMHLYESSYFLAPLLLVVLLSLSRARPMFFASQDARRPSMGHREWFALVVVVFLSSFHYYHQFFFALLAGMYGLFAAGYRRNVRHAVAGVALAALAVFVLLAKDLVRAALADPALDFAIVSQPIAAYGESERFPLKLIQLILPVADHRFELFRALRAVYDAAHPLNNENGTVSLGIVGAFGLGCVLIAAFVVPRRGRLGALGHFGVLSLIVFLVASMGGLSSIVSTVSLVLFGADFPLTQARGWNRMVIFLGFFAYAAAALVLRAVARAIAARYRVPAPRLLVQLPLVAATLLVLLWDQVPFRIANTQEAQVAFASDRAFFGEMERSLPRGAGVLQLPAKGHHEEVKYGTYSDAYRPFVATQSLRFSFGADRGSLQDVWWHELADRGATELVPAACAAGFRGALLHRHWLSAERIAEIEGLLGRGVTSPDRMFSFHPFGAGCEGIATSSQEALRAEARVLDARRTTHYDTSELPRTVGTEIGSGDDACVRAAAGETGYVAYGPYRPVRPGRYAVSIELASLGPGVLGAIDIAASHGARHLGRKDITGPRVREHPLVVEFTSNGESNVEFRVLSNGAAALDFCGLTLERLGNAR